MKHLFAWASLFYLSTFHLSMALDFKCTSYKGHIVGTYFFSALILCCIICIFKSFIFNIHILGLITVLYYFFMFALLFFFFFAFMCIILCISKVNISYAFVYNLFEHVIFYSFLRNNSKYFKPHVTVSLLA